MYLCSTVLKPSTLIPNGHEFDYAPGSSSLFFFFAFSPRHAETLATPFPISPYLLLFLHLSPAAILSSPFSSPARDVLRFLLAATSSSGSRCPSPPPCGDLDLGLAPSSSASRRPRPQARALCFGVPSLVVAARASGSPDAAADPLLAALVSPDLAAVASGSPDPVASLSSSEPRS
ncbi:hypothetical protein PR202_ga17700 [Eleusine coracana subsp. coracana]|uniref:Uncharacterized protein n=1 Tax=Eleusine coracana subsp. coracana TaxID=191504 RepID=A0AAV5CPE8_ELECO|nr:hypothetical protein PR202_ga17453 [Eleusine coracana subsp. coracana]GJN00511.1 hypothetical protein PR202_ga17700 [Eleusine coracana subsp. coracana]